MADVLFVSVNQSFNSDMLLSELEVWAASAWATTVARAGGCDRLVAMYEGFPTGAWRIRGAFPTESTYKLGNGDRRFRVGVALGDPLPVMREYFDHAPVLRRGVAVSTIPVDSLAPERGEASEPSE